MTKVGQAVVSMIFIVVLIAIGSALINQDDGIPVEFTAFWQPGDNQPKFYYLIGVQGDTLRPVGPQYTHDDFAEPGQRVELLVESDPEQPVVISECYIEFGDEHFEGEIRREGEQCFVAAIVREV
jgi:hypothetical protein